MGHASSSTPNRRLHALAAARAALVSRMGYTEQRTVLMWVTGSSKDH
jgi:hypothetical protein